MLALETLPPRDPSGGVVYLWIVLSPEEASCLQVFLNMNVTQRLTYVTVKFRFNYHGHMHKNSFLSSNVHYRFKKEPIK